MAQLDKETVKYLTMLSRIACSDEEIDKILSDLQKILSYVDQLNEIDTTNIPPCNHVLEGMVNVERNDITGEILPREVFLENSPAHVGGLIRVPPVLKQH